MTSKPITALSTIPLDKVPSPYDDMIVALQILSLKAVGVIDPEVLEFLCKRGNDIWDTVLHWVTKLKWNTKHKILGTRSRVQGTKPWGVMFYRLLDLCIQCHSLARYEGWEIPDGVTWFGCIWLECKKADFYHMVVRALQSQEIDKTFWVDELRQKVRKLRNGQNPYDATQFPCLHYLIDCSLRLAELSDDFRKHYWTPYLDAVGNCATQLERNPKGYHLTIIVRQEQQGEQTFWCVYQTCGKGKGLKLIFKK